jgi:hypothetical protein
MHREDRGGTLILDGGFGGAHVARRLPTATLVSAESSKLFTPLLPEVAAGAPGLPDHAHLPHQCRPGPLPRAARAGRRAALRCDAT